MPRHFLQDKVAVVTGGASGIGLAVCREFARHGARIAMLDMDQEALWKISKGFSEEGISVLGIVCNVTDEESCKAAMDKVLAEFGQIDILFNNAGITQRGLFEKTETRVFRQVMEVNFFGSLYCTKAALPAL